MTHRVRGVEWVLYASAAAIVAGTVGASLILEIAGPHDPHPQVVIHLDGEPWVEADVLSVPWVVENQSSWDVEQVEIEVTHADDRVDQEIDYLPRGTTRRGVARVEVGPGEPAVRVTAYRLP